jgi:flagellum-specific peptidoglycan hydrolase FlgJ
MPPAASMSEAENQFLQWAVPAAMTCERQTDVPAPVTIAQAILESGWGQTGLAQKANNYFGVKANQSELADHDYQEFPAHEVLSGKLVPVMADFAQYATPTESFLAHAQLLCSTHYAPAMHCLPDLDKFCWALGPKLPGHPEGCTYSTAPEYHDKLMQLIRMYQLAQYGRSPSQIPPAAPLQTSAGAR